MILTPTVADILRPSEKSQALLYDILLVLCGSMLIALSARISVGWPVPFTMQTFAVLMISALFGAYGATITVLIYLLEGASGLPVFSHGQGGIAVLCGPTGGYLVGFVFAAFVTGYLAQKGWDKRFSTTFLAMLAGNVIIYTFGILRLSNLFGVRQALIVGLYPFIIGAVIKISLAAALLPTGWKCMEYCGFLKKR